MKLSDLKKQGVAGDSKEKWIPQEITYNYIDEDGVEKTMRGEVMVRHFRWKDTMVVSKLAEGGADPTCAAIHHNVRLDGGKEVIPLDDISAFNPSLIFALTKALQAVNPSLPDLGKL